MLVVLVGLDGNAAQCGIAGDVLGLPQVAVAGGEAVPKQGGQLNLAAGGGEGVEVLVMDMDVALPVGLGKAGIQHIHVVELLGALGAKLQHGSHGGIAVDVGVFPLDVGINRVLEGDVLKGFHQAGVHLAHAAALGAVEDIRLGTADKALLYQHALHGVLHLLHRGGGGHVLVIFQFLHHLLCKRLGCFPSLGAGGCLESAENSVFNLGLVKLHRPAIALANVRDAHGVPPICMMDRSVINAAGHQAGKKA